mgnify:CR=1 FL=1
MEMYIRIQQDCTLQVIILGNSRQDIEDVGSQYDCSKVDLEGVYSHAVSMDTVNRHVIG